MRVAVATAHNPDAANLAKWSAAVLQAGGDYAILQDLIKDMPAPVRKAANAPMMTSDGDLQGLTGTEQILTAFVPMLKNQSAFYFMLAAKMMVQLPLRTRISYLSGNLIATAVGEGAAISVTRQSADQVFLDGQKACGILVLSKEMVTFLSQPAGQHFLSLELARAISTATDIAMFDVLDVAAPTQSSLGLTAVDAVEDVKQLLTSVGIKSESRPLFVASADVGIAAATLCGESGNLIFPAMTPVGGQMLGLPCVVTDALASGTLGLIDAASIAGSAEGVKIDLAKHASVQLNDSPDSPPSGNTVMVSLFQRGLVGLKPEVYFAVKKLRDAAFAKITNISWGGAISG